MKIDHLSQFSEVLAVGTAAGLVPVSSIHHKSTNQTFDFLTEGPSYQRLSDTLKKLQSGHIEDTFGWCEKLRYDEFQ